MPNHIDLATLRQHSKLFALLSEPGQTRLLTGATEQAFASGATLMQEGDVGRTFYLILEGNVRVRIDSLGQPKEVARLGRGAFLGEMAALLGEPRSSATVIADGAVRCLRFEAEMVDEVLRDHPRVREALVKLALKRSEDNLKQILEGEESLGDDDNEDG